MYSLELTNDIEPVIKSLYSSDERFIQKYHNLSGSPVDVCVEDTMSQFELAGENVKFNVLKQDDNVVGYFGKLDNTILGFFIHPDVRDDKNSILDMFLDCFESECMISLRFCNPRAIRYLFGRGFRPIEINNNFIVMEHRK